MVHPLAQPRLVLMQETNQQHGDAAGSCVGAAVQLFSDQPDPVSGVSVTATECTLAAAPTSLQLCFFRPIPAPPLPSRPLCIGPPKLSLTKENGLLICTHHNF